MRALHLAGPAVTASPPFASTNTISAGGNVSGASAATASPAACGIRVTSFGPRGASLHATTTTNSNAHRKTPIGTSYVSVIRSARLDTSNLRPAATIAVVTFVVLVLELTSTRLYAYIGSSHATSTALSIALLGLGIGAFVRPRLAMSSARSALALALALLASSVVATLGASLVLHSAIALVGFVLAGVLISEAYANRGTTNARATYAIDLFAAAAGCLVAPQLLGPLSPPEIIAVLGVLCSLLAGLLVPHRSRLVALIALVGLAHAGLVVAGRAHALPDGPLEALLGADVKFEKALAGGGTTARDIVDSAWSPLGRLDVHRAPKDRDRTLGVFTDGMSPTYMVKEEDARAATFESTWGLLMSLPYRALQPTRVLVLGAGAGASVWLAKKYGATQIDAVEVSPAIPDVLARWKHFAGDVYGQPGVRLYTEDARRFLNDTRERYDLIELALALTGNVHAQPAGLEAHLYTVEAVQLYLRRLTPTGSLVLIHSDPGNAYRQLLTVLEALASMGVPRAKALDGIVVLHDPRPNIAYRYMLVVRTSAIVLDVVDALDVPPAELLWGPGDPPERSTQLLDPKRLGATHRDDLSPVHDDRPYFFQNTKGLVATVIADEGRLWVFLGAFVLLLVLIVERRRQDSDAFTRPALAAASLGAAFLCVELALIQRFTLAAGGTLYAVSFVLFALLAWSAAGALVLAGRWRRSSRGVTWSALVAAVAVVATAVVVRDLAWLDAIAGEASRLALIATLLAPAGLALGSPFPVLLVHHGVPAERIGSLWAINGAASVAGGVVAVFALRVAGSFDALLVGSLLYVSAALLAPRSIQRP